MKKTQGTLLAAGAFALSILPMTVSAAFAHTVHGKAMHGKKMATTTYQCQKCHMKVSAAVAKKDHYKDPMDGGKLVPMAQAPVGKKAGAGKPMGGMKM